LNTDHSFKECTKSCPHCGEDGHRPVNFQYKTLQNGTKQLCASFSVREEDTKDRGATKDKDGGIKMEGGSSGSGSIFGAKEEKKKRKGVKRPSKRKAVKEEPDERESSGRYRSFAGVGYYAPRYESLNFDRRHERRSYERRSYCPYESRYESRQYESRRY
jgi:hypothetical protein